MTTISIPLPNDLIKFIDSQISIGEVDNRAQAVRKALRKFREDVEIREILEASAQIKRGFFYEGNLKEIMKKRKNV
jgi:Arc/MetJ-type ribon-helix-helix transcriptional regulator